MTAASFKTTEFDDGFRLVAQGDWTLESGLTRIDGALRRFAEKTLDRELEIDVAAVNALDTAGAMMLQRVMRECGARDDPSRPLRGFSGLTPQFIQLLEQAGANMAPCELEGPERNAFIMMLERMGRGTESVGGNVFAVVSFVGAITARLGGTILRPGRFRLTPMVHHMEEAGLNATLIVGLMSFLIGGVIVFMGAQILAQFGAEVFSVEMVGIIVLREFGVILTAILVAGRSGSAFTAQIGSMKLREEVDAMRVMGIDPLDALVIPRVLALILALPVLAFIAAFLGLLGGLLVAWGALDIPPALFFSRTQEIVVVSNVWVGLVKAPFIAFAIGVIGCFHGMQVENSAEELGRRTTMAVVQSLFLVILIDAMFAILFYELGI